jgi:hypothetical protein
VARDRPPDSLEAFSVTDRAVNLPMRARVSRGATRPATRVRGDTGLPAAIRVDELLWSLDTIRGLACAGRPEGVAPGVSARGVLGVKL